MKVRELIAALSKLDPEIPVVIEQEDTELVGQYVELMSVAYRDDLLYRDPKEFAMDGMAYTNPKDGYRDTTPTEPVVVVGCQPDRPVTLDGESWETPKGLTQ